MSGKCVSGDTLVFTNRGVVPIVDLMPDGANVGEFTEVSCQVRGLEGNRKVTHFYNGGRQKTIKLTTRLGYYLEGTPDHKVWVRHLDGNEGWKRLGDIAEGDVVAIEHQIDLWGEETAIDRSAAESLKGVKRYRLPSELDEDLAYIMGLLVGDGTLTYANYFMLSTGDAFIADEYRRIVNKLFGYRVGCKANGKDYFVTSKQIRVFLASLGLGYGRAHEKHVPRSILRAPKHIVIAFLQGLFDADGFVENRYGNVRLSTASLCLAREVQLLLLNLGIIASIRVKKTSSKPSYRLSINGADAIAFHERVGFRLPRKRARKALASDRRMPNIGGIPYLERTLKQVQARIVAATDKPVPLKRNKSISSIFYTYIPSGRNISYDKLDELIAYCHQSGVECPELEALQTKRYFYDYVTIIEKGEADVYDLSVASDHAYVANGFVSHNSTYLRQVALIVLMAQMGSFVPADEARIGVVDRIFTRIGAADEIAAGRSTFMVEMVETANILHHATPRSLLILDEIGRGTSTYDGMSIAWAVVEYIHNHPRLQAKTLFATHYHELTELARLLPRVRNYNVAVAGEGDQIVFLHKIVPGSADRSYGIHVAQLAGLPRVVIHRAQEILAELEKQAPGGPLRPRHPAVEQLPLFLTEDPVLEELKSLDITQMTPLEALNKLYELQQRLPAKSKAQNPKSKNF
ncbi:MAG: LAGLIDADG family homing endonuclease [Anaerolineae bacterium]|nr:LAGLIDADG family homing endonuclease [Anaerolineae bacterium]